MSQEPRKGKNWFTVMGILFVITGGVVFGKDLFIWGPDFLWQFLWNSEFNATKVMTATIIFGLIWIGIGLKKKNVNVR